MTTQQPDPRSPEQRLAEDFPGLLAWAKRRLRKKAEQAQSSQSDTA